MRLNILLSIALLVSVAVGQASTPRTSDAKDSQANTKIQKLIDSNGVILKKDFFALGTISGLGRANIEAVVVTQIGAQENVAKGVRLEVKEAGQLELRNSSFIDMDELQSLSNALALMIDSSQKLLTSSEKPYVEMVYTAKDGCQIGLSDGGAEKEGFIVVGRAVKAKASFPSSRLQDLKMMIDGAISILAKN